MLGTRLALVTFSNCFLKQITDSTVKYQFQKHQYKNHSVELKVTKILHHTDCEC